MSTVMKGAEERGAVDLLVMAAGLGSRFGGAKQLVGPGPAGETLLEYGLFDALKAGFRRVVFVIRRELEADFRRLLLDRLPPSLACALVYQDAVTLPPAAARPSSIRTKPWGTAHAVWSARDALDRPFVVMNADDFYGRAAFMTLGERLARIDPGAGDWCLAGYRLADTLSSHGSVARALIATDPAGRLLGLHEHPRIESRGGLPWAVRDDGDLMALDPEALVSMNLLGLTPAVFPRLEAFLLAFLAERRDDPGAECYLPAALGQAVAEEKATLTVLRTEAPWFGLTWREDFELAAARLRALVAAGEYPSPLWGS